MIPDQIISPDQSTGFEVSGVVENDISNLAIEKTLNFFWDPNLKTGVQTPGWIAVVLRPRGFEMRVNADLALEEK